MERELPTGFLLLARETGLIIMAQPIILKMEVISDQEYSAGLQLSQSTCFRKSKVKNLRFIRQCAEPENLET